jgi:hypothetical protein
MQQLVPPVSPASFSASRPTPSPRRPVRTTPGSRRDRRSRSVAQSASGGALFGGNVAHALHVTSRGIAPGAYSTHPFERHYIFAGLADRVSTFGQARRLWLHWGRPRSPPTSGGLQVGGPSGQFTGNICVTNVCEGMSRSPATPGSRQVAAENAWAPNAYRRGQYGWRPSRVPRAPRGRHRPDPTRVERGRGR